MLRVDDDDDDDDNEKDRPMTTYSVLACCGALTLVGPDPLSRCYWHACLILATRGAACPFLRAKRRGTTQKHISTLRILLSL